MCCESANLRSISHPANFISCSQVTEAKSDLQPIPTKASTLIIHVDFHRLSAYPTISTDEQSGILKLIADVEREGLTGG